MDVVGYALAQAIPGAAATPMTFAKETVDLSIAVNEDSTVWTIGNIVYIAYSTNAVIKYDTVANTITSYTPPATMSSNQTPVSFAVRSGKVYYWRSSTSQLTVHDPSVNSTGFVGPTHPAIASSANVGIASSSLGIHTIGTGSAHYTLDLVSLVYTQRANFPVSTNGPSLAAVDANNEMHTIFQGGATDYVYKIDTNVWENRDNAFPSYTITSSSSIATVGTDILLLDSKPTTHTIMWYNPGTKVWEDNLPPKPLVSGSYTANTFMLGGGDFFVYVATYPPNITPRFPVTVITQPKPVGKSLPTLLAYLASK